MIKEIKYNGFTATPNDYECPDGDLAGLLNLLPEDNAIKPVLPPVTLGEYGTGETIFIHATSAFRHYIKLDADRKGLSWIDDTDMDTAHDFHTFDEGVQGMNAIGNTLVVLTGSGVYYFLWDTETTPGQYVLLGQKPPMLEITFGLHSDFAVYPDKKNTSEGQGGYGGANILVGDRIANDNGILPQLGNSDGDGGEAWASPKAVMAASTSDNKDKLQKFASEYATYSIEGITGENDTDRSSLATIKNVLTNGVFARLNLFVNEKGTKENKFVMPFFVRYAYRLYDGSYIMHSYPVLMIPNSRGPIFGLDGKHGLCLRDLSGNDVKFRICGRVYGFLSTLVYNITSIPSELSKWKDIITSVDIGVSAPAFTYDQSGEVFGWTNMDDSNSWDEFYTISKITHRAGTAVSNAGWQGVKPFKQAFQEFESATRQNGYGYYFNRHSTSYTYPSYLATIPQKNISDINNVLTGATSFYIIKELPINGLQTCSEKSLELDDGTLGGLLGRKKIDDDYHSHDCLKSQFAHAYNARLNLAGIQRTPHAPLNPAIQFPQTNTAGSTVATRWQVAITIKNNTQTLTVQSEVGYNNLEFPRWIYYPDANAKFAYLTKAGTTYRAKLTPHDHLNGAYWLADIMKQSIVPTSDMATLPTINNSGSFDEKNKIYTSEVNNPFYFPVTGINTVGIGSILGICSAVKALSQGQFGQFPLYAFTTEGVWALEVSATGAYSAKQPVTRDVCINSDSITQMDNAVLFATDRGIMLLTGSNSQCISDTLDDDETFDITKLPNGDKLVELAGFTTDEFEYLPFRQFLAGCKMIYDYVNQRIIVYNPNCKYAYVYSLDSKQWGMMQSDIADGVNSYPDALAVTGDGRLVDLSETDATTAVKGMLITRPFKLDAPDLLKTIDTIIQRGYFDYHNAAGVRKVQQILYGSRDLFNWHMVFSSKDQYLRGFRGTPYKYFRLALICNLDKNERLYGFTVQFTPRYLNQPR